MSTWRCLYEANGGIGQGDPGVRPTGTSILYAQDNLYLMDNHRLALWCWLRHLETHSRYHILHMDQHLDFDPVKPGRIPGGFWTIRERTVEEFLSMEAVGEAGVLAVDWTNYMSTLVADCQNWVSSIDFCMHEPQDFDDTQTPLRTRYDVDQAGALIQQTLREVNSGELSERLILNIDIDLLFHEDEDTGRVVRFRDASFLRSLGEGLRSLRETGQVEVVTVALSPGQCRSWQAAMDGARQLFLGMGAPLRIPG
jgi:hypothetical protein